MAENYRILAVCGAGLATSTHVAKTLQTGLYTTLNHLSTLF